MALYINGKQISGGGGGGNTNSVELTYAEYQALTPEQQLDGTEYFITDINGNGQDFQPICYSEEEREIGVWIDGKPLYQLTCVGNAVTAGQQGSIDLTDYSIDTFVGVDSGASMFIRADYVTGYTLNGNELQDSQWGITVYGTPSEVRVNTRQFGLTSWFATIRYTKTTDQAGSGTWTPQGVPAHHYSNNEQVVGTWVDGKTLYEQTITFTTTNTSNYTQQDLGILSSEIDTIFVVGGFVVHEDNINNWGTYVSSVTPEQCVGFLYVGDTNISFDYRVGSSYYSSSANLIVRYTKSSS